MTSTPSQRLRLDKQATGDNPNTWGERLNGVIDLVDEAFGFAEIAVNSDVALSQQNFVSDQSRRMILRFTGAGGFAVTIPAVEHMYYIDNRCLADVILKTASTPGSAVVAGSKRIAYCDGATVTTDTSIGAPSASGVSVAPVGGIQATNVQAALQELDAEKQVALNFFPIQQSGGPGQGPNKLQLGWGSSVAALFGAVDGNSMGKIWSDHIATSSISLSGYQRLPSGLILQWGFGTDPIPDYTVTLPITYPNAILCAIACQSGFVSGDGLLATCTDNVLKASIGIRRRVSYNGSGTAGAYAYTFWFTLGF